jgi:peroxiredoxin-like protein
MQHLPHCYKVEANAAHDGNPVVESGTLQPIAIEPPPEFDGPGNLWSPETMMVGAVASCFILTFRGVARASSFPWLKLTCPAEGRLERSEGKLRFTEFTLRPTLEIPAGADRDRALHLLEKAERSCLVTNSLSSTVRLESAAIKISAEGRADVHRS